MSMDEQNQDSDVTEVEGQGRIGGLPESARGLGLSLGGHVQTTSFESERDPIGDCSRTTGVDKECCWP